MGEVCSRLASFVVANLDASIHNPNAGEEIVAGAARVLSKAQYLY